MSHWSHVRSGFDAWCAWVLPPSISLWFVKLLNSIAAAASSTYVPHGKNRLVFAPLWEDDHPLQKSCSSYCRSPMLWPRHIWLIQGPRSTQKKSRQWIWNQPRLLWIIKIGPLTDGWQMVLSLGSEPSSPFCFLRLREFEAMPMPCLIYR